jgi:hypothetical protein
MNYYIFTNEEERWGKGNYTDGLNLSSDFTTGEDFIIAKEGILTRPFVLNHSWLRKVSIPDDANLQEYIKPYLYKTDKIYLHTRKRVTPEVIIDLVEEGADLASSLKINYLAEMSYFGLVKYFIDNGAKVYLRTVLAYSLCNHKNFKRNDSHYKERRRLEADDEFIEMVKYLEEKGCDICDRDALLLAVKTGRLGVFKYIMSKWNKNSLPDFNNIVNSISDPETFDYLVEHGFCDNRIDLKRIVGFCDVKAYADMIKHLVSKGAEVNSDVLFIAICNGFCSCEIIECLVKSAPHIINEDRGRALAKAVTLGSWGFDKIKLLVENGADVHANNDWAFRNAVTLGELTVVKYLVEKGCKLTSSNKNALEYAKQNGHTKVVDYLESLGSEKRKGLYLL